MRCRACLMAFVPELRAWEHIVLRGVAKSHDFTISRRRICPRLVIVFTLRPEGAGNAGCAPHPRSRAPKCGRRRTRAYRFSGGIRHSLRNGLTAYIVLSPVGPGSLSPSSRKACQPLRNLTPASGRRGPHDFTVRIRTVRHRRIRVHRIPPRACDDRETPLVPGRDASDVFLIWGGRQVNFGKTEFSGRIP